MVMAFTPTPSRQTGLLSSELFLPESCLKQTVRSSHWETPGPNLEQEMRAKRQRRASSLTADQMQGGGQSVQRGRRVSCKTHASHQPKKTNRKSVTYGPRCTVEKAVHGYNFNFTSVWGGRGGGGRALSHHCVLTPAPRASQELDLQDELRDLSYYC